MSKKNAARLFRGSAIGFPGGYAAKKTHFVRRAGHFSKTKVLKSGGITKHLFSSHKWSKPTGQIVKYNQTTQNAIISNKLRISLNQLYLQLGSSYHSYSLIHFLSIPFKLSQVSFLILFIQLIFSFCIE